MLQGLHICPWKEILRRRFLPTKGVSITIWRRVYLKVLPLHGFRNICGFCPDFTEYSKCIECYLKVEDLFIICVFAEKVNGKLVQKGTLAKMARGEMVRYLAEIQAEKPEDAKGFNCLGFVFQQEVSSNTEYVFVREKAL